MTDDQIRQCIDSKNEVLLNNVRELIGGYTEAISTLLSSQHEDVKVSIKELKVDIEKQGETIDKLKDWKAHTEGKEEQANKSFTRTLNTLGVIIAFIMAFFGYLNLTKQQQKLEYQFNQIITPDRPRGVGETDTTTFHFYKQ